MKFGIQRHGDKYLLELPLEAGWEPGDRVVVGPSIGIAIEKRQRPAPEVEAIYRSVMREYHNVFATLAKM